MKELKSVAANKTAEQVSQAAGDDAVVIGPEGPLTPGGPGAGAARTAEKAPGFVELPLVDDIARQMGLRGPLTAAERAAIETLHGRELRLRDRPGEAVVDAKDVAGLRLVEVTTYVKHGDEDYAPDGQCFLPINFKGYVELRQIGAIIDTPWDELSPFEREAPAEA